MRRQRKACIVCHRRAGKTVALLEDLIDLGLGCEKPNGRFQFIAPLYRQAKDIAWTYLKSMTEYLGPHRTINESELWVEVPSLAGTSARVRLYGADNPDTLRGIYSDGMCLDEFKDMHPDLVNEVVLPALADRNGYLTISGTPGGYDEFYNTYQRALRDPDWFTMMLRASDSKILPDEKLAELAKEMPAQKYAQEMECDFGASNEAQFIPTEIFEQATARREPPDGHAPVVLGVDVARFGDDSSVIVTRQGRTLQDVRRYAKTDLVFLANEIMRWADNVKPAKICVDGAGVGGGVVDYLKSAGYPVEDVQVGSTAEDKVRWRNRGGELWGAMRDWLKTAQFRCDPDSVAVLRGDLLGRRYSYTLTGQVDLERKDDMKKRGLPSPDVADALALTFAVRLAPEGLNTRRFRAPHPVVDYDVMRY